MRHLLFTIIALFCIQLSSCSQGPKGFIIKGELSGKKQGIVYLSIKRDWFFFLYDSAVLNDGRFTIDGKVYDPTFATLKLKGTNDQVDLFLYKGETALTGTDSLATAAIKGCREQMQFQKFNAAVTNIRWQRNDLMKRINAGNSAPENEELKSKVSLFTEGLRDQYKSFIASSPDSYVSLYLVDSYDELCGENTAEMMRLFNGLSVGVRSSKIGKAIESQLIIREKYFVGMPAKDFTSKDASGKEVQISTLKNKAILLDFGASWCGPCRAENPYMKKIYQTYHPLGFEIVAISIDKNRQEWLNAIAKDALPWIQVSDLAGMSSIAATLYGVKAIPVNYLLDGNGKIFATERHGEDLERRIKMLVGTPP